MQRRWVNLTPCLSIIAGLAVLVLWFTTWTTDALMAPAYRCGPLLLRAAGGEVELSRGSNRNSFAIGWPMNSTEGITLASLCEHHAVGCGWDAARFPASGLPRVVIPDWFVALLAMTPLVTWLQWQRRGKRAHRLGICRSCGYDLRATPARCPECGAAPISPSLG